MALCTGWLWIRIRRKTLLVPRTVWKKFYFRLENDQLYYFRRPISRKPQGIILLRHTYIEVNSINGNQNASSKLHQFHITPLTIDKDKLKALDSQAKIEENKIKDMIIPVKPVILCADTEDDMERWVANILQASALFVVDNKKESRPSIPMLIQQSLKDSRNLLTFRNLAELTPREIQINHLDVSSELQPQGLDEEELMVRVCIHFAALFIF